LKKIIGVISLLISIYMLFGCGGCNKRTDRRDIVIFTDAMQRQVKVPKSVKRIVSLAPNVTEMLFAIGLDEEIVGVTRFCNYPPAARNKHQIGGYYDPNIEVILSLTPDLIVATPDGYSKERVEKLNQTGVSVFIVNPENIDEVFESMSLLGKVTGKEKIAKQVVEKLCSRVKAGRSGHSTQIRSQGC